MTYFRIFFSVLTAITKIPDLIRWVGGLFEKSFEERFREIEQAEKDLQVSNDPVKQDEAIKTISNNFRSGKR